MFATAGGLFGIEWILNSRKLKSVEDKTSEDALSEVEKKFEKILAICIFLFFMFYVAAEITFAQEA